MNPITEYTVVNGTAYSKKTPEKLIELLERLRQTKDRVTIIYGDVSTGKEFPPPHDSGTIGRSTGNYKIPLLIKTSRSLGGGAIMTDCIVEIRRSRGGQVLYRCNAE